MWPSLLFGDWGGTTIVSTLINGIVDGRLINATLQSLGRLATGFSISVMLGLMIGFFVYKYQWINDTLGFFLSTLQSVPNIVWFPLAILWFGLGAESVLFIIVLGATISLSITSSTAFKSVSPLHIRVARTMGSSGVHLFRTIILPATIPQLIAGLRVAWALAWRAVLAGELLGGSGGLGTLLDMGRSLQAMDLVFAIMIIIGVIGTLIDNFVFVKMERSVLRKWGINITK